MKNNNNNNNKKMRTEKSFGKKDVFRQNTPKKKNSIIMGDHEILFVGHFCWTNVCRALTKEQAGLKT